MSDTAVAAAPKAATPKKVKAAKPKAVKKPSTHPSYQDMIKKAVAALKERNGSSRQAIQKYIQATFKTCDDKASQAHLKLALKRGVEGGFLKRVKGTGASGSFRLAEKASAKPKAVKKPAAKKAAKPAGEKKAAKPKTPKVKKAKTPKKAVAEKKASKPKVAKKPKTPKKAAKPAAKKPKTPKAKKPAAKKAAAPAKK